MVELNLPSENKHGLTKTNSMQNSNADADMSYEQVLNLLKVPLVLEKFMIFGCLVCLNSFLTLFTLVPLKICIMVYRLVRKFIIHYRSLGQLSYSIISDGLRFVKRDLITISLIISTVLILSLPNLDISRMYHDVRGQAHIKLYVMFGVLEVGDKLCSSIGQDIFNILYGIPLLAFKDISTDSNRVNQLKLTIFYFLALAYLSFHSYICIYQTVSLNVAANSYSNALLALLLSNQFAELKSSVFKKFEREGLFQITMADLTERFQLTLMLGVIALRNLLQLNTTHLGLIPNSWTSWNKWIGAIFGPSIVVLGSEILVDWLKHCYITKFNRVRPRIYRNFLFVLTLDYLEVFKGPSNANLSNELSDYIVLTKRIGIPLSAYIVCFLRMTLPDLKSLFIYRDSSITYSIVVTFSLFSISFFTLLFIRLMLGLALLKWANRIKHNHQAYQAHLKSQHQYTVQQESVLSPTDNPQLYTPGRQMANSITPNQSSVASKDSNVDEISVFKSSTNALRPPRTSTGASSQPKPSVSASPKTAAKSPSFLSHGLSLLDLNLPSRTPSPIDPLLVAGNNTMDESAVIDEDPLSTNSTSQQMQEDVDLSFRSQIEMSFLPGVPNTEPSTINPTTRSYLYDFGEKVPPTVEERRNRQLMKVLKNQDKLMELSSDDEVLGKVRRYEMSSKRIW